MQHLRIITAASVLAISCPALAEGPYLGVGFGQGSVSFEDVDVSPATLSEDDTSSAYKIFIGYQFNPNFALEAGYQNFGKVNQTATFGASKLSVDYKATAFFVDAVGKIPVNKEFGLFGKFGIAATTLKADVTETGLFVGCCTNEKESETNIRFGLGAEYAFTPTITGRFEWERTSDLGDTNTTGEGDVDFLGVGIAFKF